MNVDVKIEMGKITDEIINGTVEQASEDFNNFIENWHFLTSSVIDKNLLASIGTALAKYVRKKPDKFLEFCHIVWFTLHADCRIPVGHILAGLQNFIPEQVLVSAVEMARGCKGVEDVDSLVLGFEPVILRNPEKYMSLLEKLICEDNIWIKRVVIITLGHIIFRYKTKEQVDKCLELIRPEMVNGDEYIKNATSWIIATYGVRADQIAVASYIRSFKNTKNPVVIRTFSDAIRRSKVTLQKEFCTTLIPVFEKWYNSDNSNIQHSAEGALKVLR